MKDVLVKADWLQDCEDYDIKSKKEIYYYIMRNVIFEEDLDDLNIEDVGIKTAVKLIVSQMNRVANKTQENRQNGARGGRPKILNDNEVYSMRKSGMTAKQIADQFHVTESAVKANAGWKQFTQEKKESQLNIQDFINSL